MRTKSKAKKLSNRNMESAKEISTCGEKSGKGKGCKGSRCCGG